MNQKVLIFFYIGLFVSIVGHLPDINSEIDPIVDFSAPQSLTEMLKDGLLQIKNLIEVSRQPISISMNHFLQEVYDILKSLHQTCQSYLNSSRLHVIYRDDKEMLQSLLDRINQLLESLGDSDSDNIESKKMIHENMHMIAELKDIL